MFIVLLTLDVDDVSAPVKMSQDDASVLFPASLRPGRQSTTAARREVVRGAVSPGSG